MKLRNPFVWLAGGDPEVLAECPGEARRLAAYGGAIFFTGALAGVAAAFALHSWFHLHGAWLVVAGVAWGFGIMNIDRMLFLALHRQPYRLATVALAIPRVALALLVGRIVAEPVIQQLFFAEVTQQAQTDRDQEAFAARQALDRQYGVIGRLTTQRDNLRAVIGGKALENVVESQPSWKNLQHQISAATGTANRLQHQATCELDGSCGTDKVGAGPSYQRKLDLANAAQRRVTQLQGQQKALHATLLAAARKQRGQQLANAQQDLRKVNQRLATQQHRRSVAEAKLNHDANAPIGYLDRTKALDELAKANAAVDARRNLWKWFLTAIDAMPVLLKLAMLLAVRSAYEDAEEEIRLRRLNATRVDTDAFETASRINAETIVDEAEIRRDLARDANREIHARVVQVQREAALEYVERWREAVLHETSQWVADHLRQHGPANGHRSNGSGDPSHVAASGGRGRFRRGR